MLTARARRVRVAATALTLLLLVAGTAIGRDDNFPFGPFRMYANTNKLDGVVSKGFIVAETADGKRFRLIGEQFGFRRAELEGQMRFFREDPRLIRHLATAWEQDEPGRPHLALVSVGQTIYKLENGRSTGRRNRIIATWRRPS
jgi:hypothetical protein